MPPASRHQIALDDGAPVTVEVRAQGSETLSVTAEEQTSEVRVLQSGARPVLLVGNRVVALSALGSADKGLSVARSGRTFTAESVLPGSAGGRARPAGSGVIAAPMPGRVVRIHVQPGDAVVTGATLIVIEAMKMQNAMFCPGEGTVERVLVAEGAAIERGAVLIELSLTSTSRP